MKRENWPTDILPVNCHIKVYYNGFMYTINGKRKKIKIFIFNYC